ncbi:PREDICTED: transmembrane emp24 domain-containing protein 9 [Mandrillus leucophaeus]|uniref:transmembrane emp24 domain-containing protein 9 n=1 Tax=Mandrillus leucophaeus TaxID=9568 RepID=UPI0005F45670|nr:PREDICTED: transmembrane emp24 domain-containing protein 9 [Mandrillus leucophaeus]
MTDSAHFLTQLAVFPRILPTFASRSLYSPDFAGNLWVGHIADLAPRRDLEAGHIRGICHLSQGGLTSHIFACFSPAQSQCPTCELIFCSLEATGNLKHELLPNFLQDVPGPAPVILARQYGSEGRFTFTSHTPGEHQICLHSNSTKFSLFAGGMLRVHLDIQVGEHANDYAEIAAKDKLSELQLRVRQLVEQVEQIQKEQNYQRWREERFRQTSESTNQRVLWWSILQTLILVAIGVWQMRHLKSFFEAKKLV